MSAKTGRWAGAKLIGYKGERLDIAALWFFGISAPLLAVASLVLAASCWWGR